VARYIGDGTESQGEKGRVGSTQPASSDWVKWYVYPITDEDDQYFGLTPEVAYNGEYYASLYAAFPFTPQSAGMTVYYVSKVDGDIAVLSEIKGTVPEGTPVIVKCASSQPVQNKLTLGGTADELSGNCLNGVYFKNESISHNNVTDYDKQTMRLLGTSADGKPAFVTAADTYLPRNKAYLPVSANAPAEIRIMTEAEYQASVDYVGADSDVKVYATGLTLNVDGLADGGQVEVYDAVGRSVYNGTTTVVSLPAAGVYVVRVNGLVRKIIAK
jgi:hypothetical protein